MSKKGGNEAALARKDEQERQQRIREGTSRIDDIFGAQFTPKYFDQQRQRYIDYATPQLQTQYQDAQKQLTYALARGGQLESSARGDLAAQLQKQYGLQQQQVADQALAYSGQARNNVEDARANLISTLNATGDAQGAANAAISRASALSAPTPFNPLTQLFADFTSAIGQQAAAERAYAAMSGTPTSGVSGLFGGRRGSVVNQ